MTQITTRREAIDTLQEGDRELRSVVDEVTRRGEELLGARLGGGEWTIVDLLGHVQTWEQVALETLEASRAGQTPPILPVLSAPGGIDTFNAAQFEIRRGRSLEQALAAYDETHRKLVEAIDGMTDDEWNAAPEEAPEWPLGRQLGGNTGAPDRPFGHVFAHLDDLRALVDT